MIVQVIVGWLAIVTIWAVFITAVLVFLKGARHDDEHTQGSSDGWTHRYDPQRSARR